MTVADKIKALRKKRKITQYQLAVTLDVSPSTVGMWEQGVNIPLMDTITKMSQYFNVPVTYFFEDVDILETAVLSLPLYGSVTERNGRLIYGEPIEFINIPRDWLQDGEHFLYRLGESISIRLIEGDQILIQSIQSPRDGLAAVIMDGVFTIKRMAVQGDIVIVDPGEVKEIRAFHKGDRGLVVVGNVVKVMLDDL